VRIEDDSMKMLISQVKERKVITEEIKGNLLNLGILLESMIFVNL
jgi:hypothetical protein